MHGEGGEEDMAALFLAPGAFDVFAGEEPSLSVQIDIQAPGPGISAGDPTVNRQLVSVSVGWTLRGIALLRISFTACLPATSLIFRFLVRKNTSLESLTICT